MKEIDTIDKRIRPYLTNEVGLNKWTRHKQELLCVERDIFWNEDGYDERITKNFRVLKLDLDGDNRGGKWLEKKSLGDIVLFVGDNSSIVALAFEFNIQPNCIYFTHDDIGLPTKTGRNCDLGVYNLDDQSFNFNYNIYPQLYFTGY
ncbi:hypothetical protein G4B88_005014 [Cannabis sativa]|uniref:KIB1-4 beta-propeller domain-containing protein n=1 Tax=Cannabis sativa TaxID=3483 RepID=A0A7J6H4A7_CANSA|nr:hypothetical protein G4B88_005014 [Cannabis sativa]